MRIINKLLKPFNLQLNKISSLAIEKFNHENITGFLSELGDHYYNTPFNVLNNKINGIVFSKNRAMQLHALLTSYFHYTKNPAPLTVLFTFSSVDHKQSYELLQEEFASFPVTFILENEFSFQLKELINNIKADRIFFYDG